MRKIVLTLTAAFIFGWQGLSLADSSSVDALIQKLEDKGILTDQEATTIKGEVASNEQESQQKTFKSMLPDWISNIKITGDMRLRYQEQERKVGSASTNYAHDRGRVRARINFEDQINDKVKFVFGIGTDGTGGNNGAGASMYNFSRSNNYSFGGNGANTTNQPSGDFAKDDIVLNKAYGEYKPNANLTIDIGKMDNPFWEPASISGEKFLWDPNITPEGGAIKYQKKINDYLTAYTNDAVFTVYDQGHSSSDVWMYGNQVGIKGSPTEKTYYNLAGTYYNISNPTNLIGGQRSNDLTNSTLVGNCPAGEGTTFYNNTGKTITPTSPQCYEYSYTALVGAIDLGINDPFGEMLPAYINIPQVGVRAELLKNPNSKMPEDQKNGWEFGAYMGNSALNGWGTWQASGDYRVYEQNAWMDIFPDFDQYTGDTDIKGFRTELDLGLMKNVWFDFCFFHYSIYKPFVNPALGYTGGNPNMTNAKNPENLFQLDLNMKF